MHLFFFLIMISRTIDFPTKLINSNWNIFHRNGKTLWQKSIFQITLWVHTSDFVIICFCCYSLFSILLAREEATTESLIKNIYHSISEVHLEFSEKLFYNLRSEMKLICYCWNCREFINVLLEVLYTKYVLAVVKIAFEIAISLLDYFFFNVFISSGAY